MKSKFPGHFRLNKEEIKLLWENATFALDANILLNLYRYSDETREKFYKILEKIKDRVWVPHQSAYEFFDNRLSEIGNQEKGYDNAISDLKKIESKFVNSRQHPFISKTLLDKFTELSKLICEELSENKKLHNKKINDDDILLKIEEIFDGKVGDKFDDETISKIFKEGDIRYKKNIPPGYKDKDKSNTDYNELRKYGDLVVWKQILAKAKKNKKNIIFVTDDSKEDWWVRFNGKTVSPRPELIEEFQSETEQIFHMYQSDQFLKFAGKNFNVQIDESSLEEVRDLRNSDQDLIKSIYPSDDLKMEIEILNKEINKIDKDLLNMKFREIKHKYSSLGSDNSNSPDDHKMMEIFREMDLLQEKRARLIYRLNDLDSQPTDNNRN